MGWKTFKERFGIVHHIVAVQENKIAIGSDFVRDLVTVDMTTGEVQENRTFKRFLKEYCAQLEDASPAEILDALQATDTFEVSIPVYTYDDGEIVEKQCEALGWPNVTHDGQLMHDNTFSTDPDEARQRAIRSEKGWLTTLNEGITRKEEELAELVQRKNQCQAALARLDDMGAEVRWRRVR